MPINGDDDYDNVDDSDDIDDDDDVDGDDEIDNYESDDDTYLMRSRNASNVVTFLLSAPSPSFSLIDGFPGWIVRTQTIPMTTATPVVKP